MAQCYKCGEEIEFYHDGFKSIPVHTSGNCSGSVSSYGNIWAERETSTGQRFKFGWIEFSSYVNPNAHCPVCGADVYFYQSPYGGRVFFDELGPPWPKHPCTSSEDTSVQQAVKNFKLGEASIRPNFQAEINIRLESSEEKEEPTIVQKPTLSFLTSEWQKHGWSPLLLLNAQTSGNCIFINGNELFKNKKGIEYKFVQIDIHDTFIESRAGLSFAYSMAMNPNRLISVLTENVIFIRRATEIIFEFSTISITKDHEVIRYSFRMKLN